MTATLGNTTLDSASDIVEPEDATSEQAYPFVQRGVDPQKLRAVGNSREVGDIRARRPELVASFAEHGSNPMVSMINVAMDPDGVLRVLVGFHRTAAAVAVTELENPDLLIDVLVHAPGTTRQDVLVAQGLENLHRESFTPAEEAGLYGQLALEGLDEETIARKLSLPDTQIRAGLAIASSVRTQTAATALPDADLLLLAQLAEFGDDEEAHQKLVTVLHNQPRSFDWTIGQLRRDREQRAEQIRQTHLLLDQGCTLIEDEDDLPEGVVRLDELCDKDLRPLDPQGHADCPGRALSVWVDRDLEVDVVEFCVDPAGYGHQSIVTARVAVAEEKLRSDGVPIVDPDGDGNAELRTLFADSQAGDVLTVDEHADCPGHAAYVDYDDYRETAEVHYVCVNFAARGHVLRATRVVPVQPERDAVYKAAEIKRAGVNNKAWREAKTERREWLIGYFADWRGTKAKANPKSKAKIKGIKLPARVHHWLALAPVLASDYLAEAAPAHRYACTLLKLPEPKDKRREHNPLVEHLRKQTTTENQAVAIRLAQIIGACEQHWDLEYTKEASASWRDPSKNTRYYFALMEALGYPLSPVERLINNPELDHEKWPHLIPTEQADHQAA